MEFSSFDKLGLIRGSGITFASFFLKTVIKIFIHEEFTSSEECHDSSFGFSIKSTSLEYLKRDLQVIKLIVLQKSHLTEQLLKPLFMN